MMKMAMILWYNLLLQGKSWQLHTISEGSTPSIDCDVGMKTITQFKETSHFPDRICPVPKSDDGKLAISLYVQDFLFSHWYIYN